MSSLEFITRLESVNISANASQEDPVAIAAGNEHQTPALSAPVTPPRITPRKTSAKHESPFRVTTFFNFDGYTGEGDTPTPQKLHTTTPVVSPLSNRKNKGKRHWSVVEDPEDSIHSPSKRVHALDPYYSEEFREHATLAELYPPHRSLHRWSSRRVEENWSFQKTIEEENEQYWLDWSEEEKSGFKNDKDIGSLPPPNIAETPPILNRSSGKTRGGEQDVPQGAVTGTVKTLPNTLAGSKIAALGFGTAELVSVQSAEESNLDPKAKVSRRTAAEKGKQKVQPKARQQARAGPSRVARRKETPAMAGTFESGLYPFKYTPAEEQAIWALATDKTRNGRYNALAQFAPEETFSLIEGADAVAKHMTANPAACVHLNERLEDGSPRKQLIVCKATAQWSWEDGSVTYGPVCHRPYGSLDDYRKHVYNVHLGRNEERATAAAEKRKTKTRISKSKGSKKTGKSKVSEQEKTIDNDEVDGGSKE